MQKRWKGMWERMTRDIITLKWSKRNAIGYRRDNDYTHYPQKMMKDCKDEASKNNWQQWKWYWNINWEGIEKKLIKMKALQQSLTRQLQSHPLVSVPLTVCSCPCLWSWPPHSAAASPFPSSFSASPASGYPEGRSTWLQKFQQMMGMASTSSKGIHLQKIQHYVQNLHGCHSWHCMTDLNVWIKRLMFEVIESCAKKKPQNSLPDT